MSPFDWRDRTVLVTGGTRGMGLETALAFARAGARPVITYRFGGSEDDAVARFRDEGLPAPRVFRADVAVGEQTDAMLDALKSDSDRVDGFVSNVAIASKVKDVEDYKLRGLFRSIEYSAWPLVDHTMRIHAAFGAYPRYVVAVSSLGNTRLGMHYDFVGASKAVLETLVRYLAWRLAPEGTRVNAVTCGLAETESSVGMGGDDFAAFAAWHEQHLGPIPYVRPPVVASAIFGLCSGWMDGLNGQIVTVDDGTMTFAENRYGLYRAATDPHLKEKP